MMSTLRRMVATALTLVGLAWLCQVSWGRPCQVGLLRLSWRTNGEEIRVPRIQDANLPAHMRLPDSEAYDARIRPYRLQVSLDQRAVLDRRIESPGFRHDRPLSVFEEFPVSAGPHLVEVSFTPEAVVGAPVPEQTTPFRERLEFQAGRVNLLGVDSTMAWFVKR